MKQTPPGWPRISTALFYDDPRKAIDWLVRAFDFEVRLKVEGDDGSIVHSELVYGDGLVMVSQAGGSKAHADEKKRDTSFQKSPRSVGGANTQSFMVFVDDVEAHCARAKENGATITMPIQVSDYGEQYWSDKSYECVDPEGHHFWFVQRLRSPQSS
jgi:uncharacterized glyoxalase superfamily protein PhnB